VFNQLAEYQRLGMTEDNGFRVCDANSQFDICRTYPRLFAIPAILRYTVMDHHDSPNPGCSDETIRMSAGFRAQNRFPVITWRK